MTGKFDDLLKGTLEMKENDGPDKVMSLSEAIRRNVKPGMKVHLGTTHNCAYAGILEIVRQYYGKKPEFTIIVRGIRDTGVLLVYLGLAKKAIATFSGNVYPYYGPNPANLDDVTRIAAPMLGIYGELDTRISVNVPALAEAMKKYNKSFEYKMYPGAAHAFFNDTGANYNYEEATAAWPATLPFLQRYLKGQ